MENNDDDIFILSSHDTIDGSCSGDGGSRLLAQDFVISRAPGARPDPAVQALQQAYSDLKKRYNETVQKNTQMSRALRDVERLKMSDQDMALYGDPIDSFNSQGAAATGEQTMSDDNQRAQQGYVKYLEREKVTSEARIHQLTSLKASVEENAKQMQLKYSKTVSDLKRKEDELASLKDSISELRAENLQLKDDHDMLRRHATDMQDQVKNSIPHSSLEKQNRDFEELKIKYKLMEEELSDLRKECDRLKVSEGIAQNDLAAGSRKIAELEESNTVMKAKCQFLLEELERRKDSDLPSASSVSSVSTTEELVHLKKVITDLKRQAEQQRECLKRIDRTGAPVKSRSDPGYVTQMRIMPEEPVLGSSWESVPRLQGGSVYVKDGGDPSPRRNPEGQAQPANSYNSTPRRSNSANSSFGLNTPREQSHSEILRRRKSENVLSPRSQSAVLARSNDLGNICEPSPLGDVTWQQQTMNNVNHMNGGTAQYQSAYDNSVSHRTQPVLSDTFGSAVDNTPAFPVPPELRQNTGAPHHTNATNTVTNHAPSEMTNGELQGDKICPVCSRDFSAMPIEDFQSHVFECFDDQSAPETLRAISQNERICPMCNALFPEAVPQEDFEKHVQGHFEQDIIDRFEVLNP